MTVFDLNALDSLSTSLSGLTPMTTVTEDDFGDDSWTTSYKAGRAEFRTDLVVSGKPLKGFVTFQRVALVRMRGAWQPMEDGPTVLTLDLFLRTHGEQIGVVVPGQGDRVLPPYHDAEAFAAWFSRPRLITGRAWDATPEVAKDLGLALVTAGAVDRANAGNGNGNGSTDTRRPWAFDLRLPAPDEESGGTWDTWGLDVEGFDIAVVPSDRRRRDTAARKRRADEAFNSFADGIVEVTQRLVDASDLAASSNPGDAKQGQDTLQRLNAVQRSITGVRSYPQMIDGFEETRYAAREASIKAVRIAGETYTVSTGREEATKAFSLDSIMDAKARSESFMANRAANAANVPALPPDEPV
jgi:hypothetical protein